MTRVIKLARATARRALNATYRIWPRTLGQAEKLLLPLLPLRITEPPVWPELAMTLVYRLRNVPLVERLVKQAEHAGARPVFWGLEGVAPSLAAYTIGSGPGLRSTLHNRLIECGRVPAGAYLIMSDDDIAFEVGSLRDFVALALESRFMVCQPAHLRDSYYSFPITLGHALLVARATTFVETGPITLLHPGFRSRVFPMADGMGWGEETKWFMALAEGEQNGIIDAVRIRHCSPVSAEYDTAPENARLRAALDRAGLRSTQEICRTLQRRYRWDRAWKTDPRDRQSSPDRPR